MPEKLWQTYEEVATHLLNQVAEHFEVGRFEGKQVVAGDSGAKWEIDAKGCTDGGGRTIVVECKRYTKRGVEQAIAGSLAWTIRDVGADGGILVSPLGLQEGAKKVADSAGIVEVILSETSTTTDYILSFLNQIHVGVSDSVEVTDHVEVEVRDKGGNLVNR